MPFLIDLLNRVPFLESWSFAALCCLAAMTLLWLLSLLEDDVSIVDAFWGPAFLLVSLVYFATVPGDAVGEGQPRRLLLLLLVALWSVRLGGHIAWRSRGEGEDRRYATMRRRVGAIFRWRSLVTVFWLQGALVSVIAIPLYLVLSRPTPSLWLWSDVLGLLLWTLGFVFEAGADYQLLRFKSDPASQGQVLRHGFWALSRHPNYFGEACLWWGFFCFALAAPGGLWALPSALLMTFLLLKVSGVTLLEKTIVERRPAYRDYIESTPAFFPRLPFPARGRR